MSQYNILQSIFMSFYSKKLYRDVAVNWGGRSFLYLLLVLALSWIAFTFQFQSIINKGYEEYGDNLIKQAPILTIENGKVSTPENHPYLIIDPHSKQTIAVFDTSGKYTDLNQIHAAILVKDTEIISKPKPETIRIDKIPAKLNMIIRPQVINSYIKNFLSYSWVLIFIVAWLGSFIYRIIEVLFYGLIGKIFTAIFNVTLSYSQIVQIGMVAITPVIIVATVLDFFMIYFNHQLLAYFALGLLYLFYGIIANKK